MTGKNIPEVATVSSLITFAIGTGCALLGGGTLMERLGKNNKDEKPN
jgi:hypothetical protein